MILTIKKISPIEKLSTLKNAYIASTTTAIDGMWLFGFVPMAEHFGFYDDEKLVGFYCVNDEGYLLQFYLCDEYLGWSAAMFNQLFQSDSAPARQLTGAFVSTAEPYLLSLCLDRFEKYQVNALMYQKHQACVIKRDNEQEMDLRLMVMSDLEQAIGFTVAHVGMPAEWLKGYYTGLISREELWGYWDGDCLKATGESRGRNGYQVGYADLGMIVAEPERGKGVGTAVLKSLVKITETNGLKPICSTEAENIGALKAIERAGFFAGHRILQFEVK